MAPNGLMRQQSIHWLHNLEPQQMQYFICILFTRCIMEINLDMRTVHACANLYILDWRFSILLLEGQWPVEFSFYQLQHTCQKVSSESNDLD